MKMVSRHIRPLRSVVKNLKSSPTQNCLVFQPLQSAGARNACLLSCSESRGGFRVMCNPQISTVAIALKSTV